MKPLGRFVVLVCVAVVAVFVGSWFLQLSYNGSIANVSRSQDLSYGNSIAFFFFLIFVGMLLAAGYALWEAMNWVDRG